MPLTELENGYTKVVDERWAKETWEAWFSHTLNKCSHGDNCRT